MIQIQWTSPNIKEARKIARLLLESKLIACANLIPYVESIYTWKGKVETSHEVKVLLKTRKELFSAVKKMIQDHCSYDVPEISKISIDEAHKPYLTWLKESTGKRKAKSFANAP